MSDRPDIKKVWLAQRSEETVTLSNIHQRAKRFDLAIRRRNLRAYVGVAVTAIVYGWIAVTFPSWLMKIGCILTVAAMLLMVWRLYRLAPGPGLTDDYGKNFIERYKHELERRRDAARSNWLWFAPFAPGLALVLAGRYLEFHAPGRSLVGDHQIIALSAIIALMGFGLASLVNLLRAEKYQREIDELTRLEKE